MLDSLQPVVQDFLVTLCTGVLAVLSGFLIALAKKGVDWVNEKIQSIQDDKIRQDVENAVAKLDTIVTTTVTALQQSLGDDIKNSIVNNDGKYTKEDLLALKDQAFLTIKNQLTVSTTELLNSTYEDLDSLINNMIEAAVRNIKLESTPLTELLVSGEESTTKVLNE